MTQIKTYTAQRGLNPGSTPGAELANPVAQQLQNVGNEVQDVAATFIQRGEQRENFKVENDYRRLKAELQNDLNNSAQNMPEGGVGFHDQFLTDTFKPKRDAFLATVPERLKPQFEAVLNDETGADAFDWSTAAAGAERDESYRWQKSEIGLTHEQLANAIALDPEGFDNYQKDGLALIKSSSLPTPEKAELEKSWRDMARVSYFNKLLETDPSGVLRKLGNDPRQLSPTTQFSLLSKAVQWQESTDNPNAVSGKGAVGLMQVMPDTAREIAGKIGDTNFPTDKEDIAAYLTNPYVNKQYGEYYLKQQLTTFANTQNPIETALVAYNAGPSVAQKWVESGYDDKTLPKETRDYKDQILATLAPPVVKGNPASVEFIGLGEGTNADLQARTADAFATLGLTKVKVNSGYRDPQHNAEVGGAKGSQHLDGNAMDIDVSGMSRADRVELIKAFSASGITGIGVYANTIHVDLGGRRAWGPSHTSSDIPAWAAPVIAQHLNGTTPPPRAIDAQFADMPYDERQQFVTKADQIISAQATADAKSTAVQKVDVRRQMDNELASIRATGQTTGMNVGDVATILGEDDYMAFERRRDVAQRSYTAVQGVNTMTQDDMTQRLEQYAPTPGAADFADQQDVQAAVQKEVDRVTRLRSTSPDQAALEYPEVKGAYQAVLDQGESPEPATVQAFVNSMMNTQGDFGVAPAARAPIPHDWAIEIGKAFSTIPAPGAKEFDRNQMLATVTAQYNSLKQFYGDYTDEVIVYALSEYKGVSKPQAEMLGGLVNALATGKTIYKPPVDLADQGQVEGFNLFFGPGARDLLGLPGGANDVVAPIDDGLSPEERLRQNPTEE